MSNNNGVRFLHYRLINRDGKPDGRGGATVAYRLVAKADGHSSSDTVQYAVARCRLGYGSSDNFNRRIGRDIATGRLLKNPSEMEFISTADSDGIEALRAFENWMDRTMELGIGDGDWRVPFFRVRKPKPKTNQCGDNSCNCSCPTL
jgi:hypothetical protein